MEERTKRKLIRNYFRPFPKWAVWMIVIGIPLLAARGSGIILIGLGILGIVRYIKGKATDLQMDEWLNEELNKLDSKALNKMNIDKSELIGEPVLVTGPRLWDVSGAEVLYKKGKDNRLRFSPVNVQLINFTQNQLLIYNCALDLITGNPLNEETDEYFYKDVVSVSTKTESITKDIPRLGKVQMNEAESFILTTSGGTSVSIFLRDPKLIEQMGGGEIPTTQAEKAIQVIRKMLRDKKV